MEILVNHRNIGTLLIPPLLEVVTAEMGFWAYWVWSVHGCNQGRWISGETTSKTLLKRQAFRGGWFQRQNGQNS